MVEYGIVVGCTGRLTLDLLALLAPAPAPAPTLRVPREDHLDPSPVARQLLGWIVHLDLGAYSEDRRGDR